MMTEPLQIGGIALDPLAVMLGLAGTVVVLLAALLIVFMVMLGRRRTDARAQDEQMAELKVRLQTLAEASNSSHSQLQRAVNERLDRISHRVGSDLTTTAQRTNESIAKLHERLAVIDTAQKNLTDLSSNMMSLQQILANKQSRGAFGQMRMETIIKDGLPVGHYTFQATLSNGKRPDCLLHMPNNEAGVVIDAKFPLEGFEAFRVARGEQEQKEAGRRIKVDVAKHIDDMAAKYFITGETQDNAILFVPSESVYADLAEHFPDLVQRAHRARIVICAPNMLMLAVQTMQAILKDVKMREQAGLIQKEVAMLCDDISRLGDRVGNLQNHFAQANKDIDQIVTSSDKISKRGRKIENLDFEQSPAEVAQSQSGPRITRGPEQAERRSQADLLAGE
ncbi:DNA recombination protein RmuC [Methyloligella halotolerans]|nr:DNA recombination protein RmuC [Methyloligella halotolerans]